MRNIYCGIADIRKRVFAEVAKLAYEGGDYHRIDKLPYEICLLYTSDAADE